MGIAKERFTLVHQIHEDDDKAIWLAYEELEQKYFILKGFNKNISTQIYYKIKVNPHPNIANVYSIFQEDGMNYVVEEFFNAPSLALVMSRGQLKETYIISYMHQLCSALQHLHAMDPPIIHRDIKAENILCEGDRIKLIDFDIARLYDGSASRDTRILGSVGYAAPEQFGFNQSDERTDIYAVGVLLNYMLTGNHPKDEIAKGKWHGIIEKCIAIDPDDRYQNVQVLDNAIAHIVEKKHVKNSDWRLPGFRNNMTSRKIFAGICYCAVILYCGIATFKGNTATHILFNRIFLFLIVMHSVFIIGNYRDIWDLVTLTNSDNKFVKVIGVALIWFTTFILLTLILLYCEKLAESLL